MDIFDMTDDEARALFHSLGAEREAILAVATPMREARDAFVQNADQQRRDMDAEIAVAETGLFEIDQKRGRIARMLGGKTGIPG